MKTTIAFGVCLLLFCSNGCQPTTTPSAKSQPSNARQATEETATPVVESSRNIATDVEQPSEPIESIAPSMPPIETETKAPDSSEVESTVASKSSGFAKSIQILSWNVESDGSNPEVIAKQLKEWNNIDVFALCEVLPSQFENFANGMAEIHSESGDKDRLMIAYNDDRFELVRQLNLDDINNGRVRAPLVAHLRERESGKEFLLVNNHLARGNAEYRQEQARLLVEWARESTLPIVAVGDYNFDFVFETSNGNDSFREFMRDGIWEWIQPSEMIDSNWYDGDGDGADDYPGSILDFVFVAGSAREWPIACEVIVRADDFPDDDQTSDHRPILTVIGK
ncbi:MAG: hypothetical protein R3C03_07155 [Pirellulaceae bacterium]